MDIHSPLRPIVISTAFCLLALGAVAAERPADDARDAQRYAKCMAQARDNPEQAFETALGWQSLGGGDPAQHCIAAALMSLKIYHEAAARFESIAQKTKKGDKVRAGLLGQAAQGWLLAGQADRADGVLTAALKLTPDDPDLLIDRAGARAQLGRFDESVKDLERAVEIDPKRPDAHAFMASALRQSDRPKEAAAAVEKALALDPEHVEALLERGMLRRMAGDDPGARRDWLAVLHRAPTTAAADVARANLEKMDVKLPQ